MSSLPEFNRTGHVVVTPPSRLTLTAVTEFVASVDSALVWCPWVILDMSQVVQLDGSGLHALNWARTLATKSGGDAVIVGLAHEVLRPSELALLGQLFTIYRDFDAVPDLPPREERLDAIPVRGQNDTSAMLPPQ